MQAAEDLRAGEFRQDEVEDQNVRLRTGAELEHVAPVIGFADDLVGIFGGKHAGHHLAQSGVLLREDNAFFHERSWDVGLTNPATERQGAKLASE